MRLWLFSDCQTICVLTGIIENEQELVLKKQKSRDKAICKET